MGFDNRKRDDHGHVIGNDETDGQECKHQDGNKSNPKDKYGNDIDLDNLDSYDEDDIYEKDEKGFVLLPKRRRKDIEDALAERNSAFDDDYDEEFEDRAEKIANDAREYFNDNQLNELKKYCDRYEVDFELAKVELAKRFDDIQKNHGLHGVDAANAALDTLTDDIVMGYNPNKDEYEEEMAKAQNENADMSENEESEQDDDPIYSHFMKKFNSSKDELDQLRAHDYDKRTYKDNS